MPPSLPAGASASSWAGIADRLEVQREAVAAVLVGEVHPPRPQRVAWGRADPAKLIAVAAMVEPI